MYSGQVDENYYDDFDAFDAFNLSGSPFWSHLLLRWFAEPLCLAAKDWRSSDALRRSEELLSCTSLLTFIASRLGTVAIADTKIRNEVLELLNSLGSHLGSLKTRLFARVSKSLKALHTVAPDDRMSRNAEFSLTDSLKLELIASNIGRYQTLISEIYN